MNDGIGILYSDSEFMDLTPSLMLAPPVPVQWILASRITARFLSGKSPVPMILRPSYKSQVIFPILHVVHLYAYSVPVHLHLVLYICRLYSTY